MNPTSPFFPLQRVYCSKQDTSLSSFHTIEEGVQVITHLLEKNILCSHDVIDLSQAYQMIDQLEKKANAITEKDSNTALDKIVQKIHAMRENTSVEQIITAYHLQKFDVYPINQAFTFLFPAMNVTLEKVKDIATHLPFCNSEDHFDADIRALIGEAPSADATAILQGKKDLFYRHTELKRLRKKDPVRYPPYLDEILDGGFFYLYDHLIAMKKLSPEMDRKTVVEQLPFSSFAKIILEFREAVLTKMEKMIPSESNNIVFLLGDTRSGKSTTLCYLRRDPMELDGTNYQSSIDQNRLIGHNSETSCTLFPNVATDPDIVLIDFPGFVDTHGKVISLAIELTLRALVKKYSPKIMLLTSITDDNGGFKSANELGNRVKRILGNLDNCILGLTKYSKDPDFIEIKNIEKRQREELSRPSQEELNLETEIKTLSPLVQSLPLLQNKINEKKDKLIELQQARLSLSMNALPDTEEKSKHLENLRKKEETFKRQIGIGKLISLADLTDQVELEKIFQILKSQKRVTFAQVDKTLDLEHKDLIGILFNRDFNCFIDPIEKENSSPSSSPVSSNISTSGETIANSIKSSNPLSSSISTSEDAIVKNIKTFEQNILEMSLINTMLSDSHPEIGKFFHLDEMDPAIVRKYDKAVITACIKGYIGEVISDSLVNEGIITQYLKQSKAIDSDLSSLKNYILKLRGAPSNMDEVRLKKEWEQLEKEHKQQLNRKKEQFQLPKWMTAALLIPLGIPYGVFATFAAIKLDKTRDKLSKDTALELSQKIKAVYQGIIALKDIENVVNKQDNIAKSIASNPLSLDSVSSLRESIERQINQVKISYGEEDWNKRVEFLIEQFGLDFSSIRSNSPLGEKILYALISQKVSYERLPPYFNEHTFLARIYSFMSSQNNYQDTIQQLFPSWEEASYLDLKLNNLEYFFHISSVTKQEHRSLLEKGQLLFERYSKTPAIRLLLLDVINKLRKEVSIAHTDETERSRTSSTENDRKKILQAVKDNPWILEYSKERLSKDQKFVLAAVGQNGLALQFASEALQNDRDFILSAVQQNGLVLQYASETLKNDREVVLSAVQQNEVALQFTSETLKNDRDFILSAVQQNGLVLQYASEVLQNDREIVLAAVRQDGELLLYPIKLLNDDEDSIFTDIQQNGLVLQYASETLKNDQEVVLAAVKLCGEALRYASETLKNDQEVVLAAVREDGKALRYASETLKNDQEVVLAAVREDGKALRYASETLKNDQEVVLAAVREDGKALRYASEVLQNDKDFVIAAIEHCGPTLQHVSEILKNKREIVLAAVEYYGPTLQYVSETLKNDREVVLAAVEQSGEALQFASETLKNDREVVLAAVEQSGKALQFASETLKNDREVVLAAVEQSGKALQFASETLKNDREVVITAVKQNGNAFQYASKRLKNDRKAILADVMSEEEESWYVNETHMMVEM
ncbi:DUF4116 domain-containing protein [Rhabdochlamydiaceae symbiont of Dictyostelium giganteum]|uniref:DUF4116 domain-containing protein n=1 Tax=Rhabdochlamydiaceae symbiont of Dictyostelium giganteum TaxID=3342349 RepID=UPI0038514F01